MRPALAAATLFAAALLANAAFAQSPPLPDDKAGRVRDLRTAEDPTFRPGQVWRYHTRPLEQRSRLVVCQVDSSPELGTIVHIQVRGIRMRRRASALGYVTTADHVPLTRDALVVSVVDLERSDEDCGDFKAAYWKWRRQLYPALGRASVFAVSVAEALDILERSLRSGAAGAGG